MHADGHFIFPVIVNEDDETQFAFRLIQTKDGKVWNAAFTSHEEFEKGAPSRVISNFIDSTMKKSTSWRLPIWPGTTKRMSPVS